MIPVQAAKNIIENSMISLNPCEVILSDAMGLILASDVYSTIDIPSFDQSAMDGYALSFADWEHSKKLKIAGEIQAGSDKPIELLPGQAIRIFTGAPLPLGADTVVMQEKVQVENGELIIEDDHLTAGRNKRNKGSEIEAGMLAMLKGSFLSPAAIGFLAGTGTAKVRVYPKPSVSIIVTGKELQKPGNALEYAQVYESNSFALEAALKELHFNRIDIINCDDNLNILSNILAHSLKEFDIVLLTGGISVGDYDFVLQAAELNGVEKLFHKIKQKPGKPLYFGKKGNTYVFGLPGNPSSVLTCFYQYVIPALYALCNQINPVKIIEAPINDTYEKQAGLTHFLKGFYDGKKVEILGAQESYRMRSFAGANCLIEVDAAKTICLKGEIIKVHLLPNWQQLLKY